MQQTIRAAIIGSGVMGGIHGKILQQSDTARVEYVVDTDAARAESLATQLGCKALTDIGQLTPAEVDLAFVTVPNNLHARLAIQVLGQGIHVFSEKPLATSLADAKGMVDAADTNGKRLFVGHNRRFAPVYADAKEAVSQADYAPQSINVIQNDGDMGGEGSLWAADFATLGGFLYDTTIHFLDMAEYLMGEIRQVTALSKQACYPVEDNFAIQLQFQNGGIGAITSCGHASWIYPFERVQVVGDHRSVITEELDSYRYCPGLSKIIEAREYTKLPFEEKWGYVAMHRHMLDALRHDKPALNDGRVGLRAVRLVEACQRSAASGGVPVEIDKL